MGPVSRFVFVPALPGILTNIIISGRLAVRWRRLLPYDHVPDRLSLQATEGQLYDQDLPPQHQCEWIDLSRYFKGPVVASVDDLERFVSCFHTWIRRSETRFSLSLQSCFRFARC